MTRPRLSIVMPAHNAAGTVATAVRSALTQTLEQIELILIDDGSSDATVDLAREAAGDDGRLVLIEQDNAGPAEARNNGIARAQGDFIGFLDSDDAWLPEYAERVCDTLATSREAGLAYADCWMIRDGGRRVFHKTALQSYPPVPATEDAALTHLALLRQNFITASSVTLTRDAIKSVGGFNAKMAASEDWDLWLRVVGAGYRAVRADSEPLVLLRDTATSISKDPQLMARSAVEVMRDRELKLPSGSEAQQLAAERTRGLESELTRHTDPTPAERLTERLRILGRPTKRLLFDRRLWRPANPQVTAALQRLGEP